MRVIHIQAKCSDLCFTSFTDSETEFEVEREGYVPNNLGVGGGDYIEIAIDADTGKILDWQPMSNEEIAESLWPSKT